MTDSDIIADAKKALRAKALAARAAVGGRARRAAAQTLAETGLSFLPDAFRGRAVAGYAAIRDELDPAMLMEVLAADGHTLALPVMLGPDAPLAFRHWRPGEPLRPNELGVPEPLEDAAPAVPDVVLTPLVAFDRAGYRLGFGKGFYDRTLRALRASRRIAAVGVAFDEQRVDTVPHEPFDERLDWILTPSGPLRMKDRA